MLHGTHKLYTQQNIERLEAHLTSNKTLALRCQNSVNKTETHQRAGDTSKVPARLLLKTKHVLATAGRKVKSGKEPNRTVALNEVPAEANGMEQER